MDPTLVKLLKHMELLTKLDASDYAERLTIPIELTIQNTYRQLGTHEKAWIDSRVNIADYYEWKYPTDELGYKVDELREEYMNMYIPKHAQKELFIWLDRLLRSSTFEHMNYDTEYIYWNISRCRKELSPSEVAWIDLRFSIDNLLRRDTYSEDDVLGMYDAWEDFEQ